MADKSQRQRERDGTLLSLNMAVDALNRAKEATSMTPAKAAFTSAGILLATIRVSSPPVHLSRLLANVYRTRWPTKWNMLNWG